MKIGPVPDLQELPSIISSFFARRAKQASAEGRSPPQELEVGPRSGPYLLLEVNHKIIWNPFCLYFQLHSCIAWSPSEVRLARSALTIPAGSPIMFGCGPSSTYSLHESRVQGNFSTGFIFLLGKGRRKEIDHPTLSRRLKYTVPSQ